jgi:hypothetical protein
MKVLWCITKNRLCALLRFFASARRRENALYLRNRIIFFIWLAAFIFSYFFLLAGTKFDVLERLGVYYS